MQISAIVRTAAVAATLGCGAVSAAPTLAPLNLHHQKPEFTYIDASVGRNADLDATAIRIAAYYAPYRDLFFKLGLSHHLSNSSDAKVSAITGGVGMNYDTTTLGKPTSLYGILSLGISNASPDRDFNEVEAALEVGARALVAPRFEVNAAIQVGSAPGASDETLSFILGMVYRISDQWDIGLELEDAENVMFNLRYHFDHWVEK